MLSKDTFMKLFHTLCDRIFPELHSQLREEVEWKEEYGLAVVDLAAFPGGFEFRYERGDTLITVLVDALHIITWNRVKAGLIIQAPTGQVLFSFEFIKGPTMEGFHEIVDLIEDCIIQLKGVHIRDLHYFEAEEDTLIQLTPKQEVEDVVKEER